MGITVNVDAYTVGNELASDAEFAAEVVNEVAYRMGEGEEIPPKWLSEFVENVDDGGRELIMAVAAKIAADEQSEGGA